MAKINRAECTGCFFNTGRGCEIDGVRPGDAACLVDQSNAGPLVIKPEESEKQMKKLIDMRNRYETFTNSGNNPSDGNARSR